MLFYLLRDRRASRFWYSNSSSFVSLSLCLWSHASSLSLFSSASLLALQRGEGVESLEGAARAFFSFFFPFPSRTNLCLLLLKCRFPYHNPSWRRSCSSRRKKGSNSCSIVCQDCRFCISCRDFIFSPWGGRGLFSKSHYSSFAFLSLLRNWKRTSFFSLLFLTLFRRLGFFLSSTTLLSSRIFLLLNLLPFLLFLFLSLEGFHCGCRSFVITCMPIQWQLSPNKNPSEKHAIW